MDASNLLKPKLARRRTSLYGCYNSWWIQRIYWKRSCTS
jgi:hypothetical protein